MAEYVETLLAPGETIVTNARQHWMALVRFALTPIVILALGFLGLLLGAWLGSWTAFQGVAGLLDWAVGLATVVAFAVAIVWIPIQFIRWGSRRYVLTSRRVLTSDGWLRKTTSDASLDKITDVDYSQTFLGARMGFGDLVIQTASNTPLNMPEIRDAIEFKKAIMVAQEEMVKSRAASMMAAQGIILPPAAAAAAPGMAAAAAPAAPVAPAPGGIPGASVPRQPGVPGSGAAVPPPPPPPPAPVAMTPAEITATLASLTDMKEAGTITEADYEAKKKELLDRL